MHKARVECNVSRDGKELKYSICFLLSYIQVHLSISEVSDIFRPIPSLSRYLGTLETLRSVPIVTIDGDSRL